LLALAPAVSCDFGTVTSRPQARGRGGYAVGTVESRKHGRRPKTSVPDKQYYDDDQKSCGVHASPFVKPPPVDSSPALFGRSNKKTAAVASPPAAPTLPARGGV